MDKEIHVNDLPMNWIEISCVAKSAVTELI
jgi:hypothetical protein